MRYEKGEVAMRYFTGTTLECLHSIVKDGFILTRPPERVWEDYSEDYVYLLPFDQHNEEEREEMFRFAGEQSSFAIYELDGSARVILEIEGIDEAFLDDDPDGRGIGAIRHSQDIPIQNIVNVYVEKNRDRNSILELIAITHYLRQKDNKELPFFDTEVFVYGTEEEIQEMFDIIGISHLELIKSWYMEDEDALRTRYDELMEDVELCPTFEKHPISSFQTQIA